MLILCSPFVTSLIRRKAKNINANMALSKARVKVVHTVADSALTNFFKSCVERGLRIYILGRCLATPRMCLVTRYLDVGSMKPVDL